MEATIERPVVLVRGSCQGETARLLERQRAEATIAELLIINEEGLSWEQVESFIRACAVLRV